MTMNCRSRCRADLIAAVLLVCALMGLSPAAAAFGPCEPGCSTGHHKLAVSSLDFGDGQLTAPVEFALAGFGYGDADAPVVCPPEAPNPQLREATAPWTDFRFYAMIPQLGIVRATLNREHTSYVQLDALTPDGLFPAHFLNHLYLTLTALDYPGLVYQNKVPMVLSAAATSTAPPNPSVVGTPDNPEDVFEAVNPMPGAPLRVIITGGVQEFLVPGGLTLERISNAGGIWSFRVTNQLNQQVTAGYFGYVIAMNPMYTENLDGTVTIPAGGQAYFALDMNNVPLGPNQRVVIEVNVFDPASVVAMDRLEFLGS